MDYLYPDKGWHGNFLLKDLKEDALCNLSGFAPNTLCKSIWDSLNLKPSEKLFNFFRRSFVLF